MQTGYVNGTCNNAGFKVVVGEVASENGNWNERKILITAF